MDGGGIVAMLRHKEWWWDNDHIKHKGRWGIVAKLRHKGWLWDNGHAKA